MEKIIFNADVGEGTGFDHKIMPYISWCNISCGAHAGNDEVIQETIKLAAKYKVKIGAHPSYPDHENFGRRSLDMPYDDLLKSITDQILKVKRFTEQAGLQLHHIKPHGALYNDTIINKTVAKAVVESIKNIDKGLSVVTLKNGLLSDLSIGTLDVKYEAFADRNYNNDLTLVSRLENDAVITNPKRVFNHVFRMVKEGKVRTIKNEDKPVVFDTICVHGDNPKSVEILKYVHQKFSDLNFDF
ncbi:5-oxoprolinase subunit PxpA [Aquimarina mytili]|uniref:5-oxoprolinase subunit PxpA n=1 Tax=Aquimarina mytili TaxID=874423 RepID=A0A937D720_9FLAO|nr:5-oxoprolinase subunit PxpA [Aquimarina mytili]MBL0682645.1 5-oxoprolinase subunit PxpA [Aquimarina mytili]